MLKVLVTEKRLKMSMCHSSGCCAVELGEVWAEHGCFQLFCKLMYKGENCPLALRPWGTASMSSTTNVLCFTAARSLSRRMQVKGWNLSLSSSSLNKYRVSANSSWISVNAGIGECHRGTLSVLLRVFFCILIHAEVDMLKKPLPCYAWWRITCQWACLVPESWGNSSGRCPGTSRDNFQLSNSNIWQISLKGPVPLIFSCLPNFGYC